MPEYYTPATVFINKKAREDLSRIITRREISKFKGECDRFNEELSERYGNKSILILGAGGFIARETINVIMSYNPSCLILIDENENGLVETVRSIRASSDQINRIALQPILADISCPSIKRVLRNLKLVDVTLNFAATKHVRSERDENSALKMLQTNVLGCKYVVDALEDYHQDSKFFSVSTDKAADPVNFMGASKNLMEQILAASNLSTTSARFANVAFSTGSLLESWLIRLSNGEPLSVPKNTFRFFVSPREAGELCAIATLAPNRSVVIPNFATNESKSLEEVLSAILDRFNIVPNWEDFPESNLKTDYISRKMGSGSCRVYLTGRNTVGEKQVEKFIAGHESAEPWTTELSLISMQKPFGDLESLFRDLENLLKSTDSDLNLSDIHQMYTSSVQNFRHMGSKEFLDDRI